MLIKSSGKFLVAVLIFILVSCKKDDTGTINTGLLQLTSIKAGTDVFDLTAGASNSEVPVDMPFLITFTTALDTGTVAAAVQIITAGNSLPLKITFQNQQKTIAAQPLVQLANNTTYQLQITAALLGAQKETYPGISVNFTTIPGSINIVSIQVEGKELFTTSRVTDVNRNFPATITFDQKIDAASLDANSVRIYNGGEYATVQFALIDSGKKDRKSVV